MIQFQSNVGGHPGTVTKDGQLEPGAWEWEVANGPALVPSLPDPQPIVEQFTRDLAAYRAGMDLGRAPLVAYRTVAIAPDDVGDFTQIAVDYTYQPQP